MLSALQKVLRGEPADGLAMSFPPPVAQLIGFRPVEVGAGRTVFQLEVRQDRHANPMGTLHGGILCDLADA